MDQSSVIDSITSTFPGVDVVTASDNSFFFYDPGRDLPVDHRFPFATLVTNDAYDSFSELGRPGVFRLNVGVTRQTFQSLFGPPAGTDAPDPAHDYTAIDRIMPHPVYGRMYWVCVLNPTDATFEALKPLLAEAYEQAARRYVKTHP